MTSVCKIITQQVVSHYIIYNKINSLLSLQNCNRKVIGH